MWICAIVLGLLSPVLAFSIASGSGFSASSTISYSAQSFKIGAGITPYSPDSLNNREQQKSNGNF
jgi:hypothetical protein